MPAVRIVVRGRVQGVGFRYFVRQIAREAGVTGEVWNRSDRAVELLAQHEDADSLRRFVEMIETGPGQIRDLQTESTAERGFEAFEIGATR